MPGLVRPSVITVQPEIDIEVRVKFVIVKVMKRTAAHFLQQIFESTKGFIFSVNFQ